VTETWRAQFRNNWNDWNVLNGWNEKVMWRLPMANDRC